MSACSQRERLNAEIEDGVDCDFVATPGPELVAFGMWRCRCTMIAATLDEIPQRCPSHDSGLLDRPSWEENPHRVPLHKARACQRPSRE